MVLGHEVDKDQMAVVRCRFRMVGEDGMTLYAVRKDLTTAGIPSPSREVLAHLDGSLEARRDVPLDVSKFNITNRTTVLAIAGNLLYTLSGRTSCVSISSVLRMRRWKTASCFLLDTAEGVLPTLSNIRP